MDQQHDTHAAVLLSGADYLDGIVADMDAQAAAMEERARETDIGQVRAGYERFAGVLHHCADTLRDKSRELRST